MIGKLTPVVSEAVCLSRDERSISQLWYLKGKASRDTARKPFPANNLQKSAPIFANFFGRTLATFCAAQREIRCFFATNATLQEQT